MSANDIPRTRRRKGQSRPHAIRLRVTAHEAALIQAFAAERRTSVSELLRYHLVQMGALPAEALKRPLKGSSGQADG